MSVELHGQLAPKCARRFSRGGPATLFAGRQGHGPRKRLPSGRNLAATGRGPQRLGHKGTGASAVVAAARAAVCGASASAGSLGTAARQAPPCGPPCERRSALGAGCREGNAIVKIARPRRMMLPAVRPVRVWWAGAVVGGAPRGAAVPSLILPADNASIAQPGTSSCGSSGQATVAQSVASLFFCRTFSRLQKQAAVQSCSWASVRSVRALAQRQAAGACRGCKQAPA